MRLLTLLTFVVFSSFCVAEKPTTFDQLVDHTVDNLKSESGFQRYFGIGFSESLHGLAFFTGADIDESEVLLQRDMAHVAAEDSQMMGALGYLVGFLLNPVLWVVFFTVAYLSRDIPHKLSRGAVTAGAVLAVSALLTPQLPGVEIPRITMPSIVGSLIYGWFALFFFKPKNEVGKNKEATDAVKDESSIPNDDLASPENISIEAEEKFLEKIASDYRAGRIREGIWAKAVMEAEGDETKAYARYLKMMLKIALNDGKL